MRKYKLKEEDDNARIVTRGKGNPLTRRIVNKNEMDMYMMEEFQEEEDEE